MTHITYVKEIFCTFFLLWFNVKSKAQPFIDVVNFSLYKSRPTNFFSSDDNSFYSNSFSINSTLPLKLDSNNLISLNPFVDSHRYQLKTNRGSTRYTSIGIPIFFIHQWKNTHWKTSAGFVGRMNKNDDKDETKNIYQYGGVLLNTFWKKESIKFKFGVYLNTEFYGLYVTPLLGLDWRVNKKLNVFGVLPSNMNAEYKLHSRLHTGIAFKGSIASYRIEDEFFYRVDDNYIKLFADVYATKKIVLTVEYGHSVLRRIRTGKRTDSKTEYLNDEKANGYFLKAGVAYRIRMDKE
ncbi:MAG: hypothetical protein IPJ79_05050 [Bacteroidetes bacterium]|nr:hypothetical protein [Bacteroidota bacterium]